MVCGRGQTVARDSGQRLSRAASWPASWLLEGRRARRAAIKRAGRTIYARRAFAGRPASLKFIAVRARRQSAGRVASRARMLRDELRAKSEERRANWN